jgi:hypothetical protein
VQEYDFSAVAFLKSSSLASPDEEQIPPTMPNDNKPDTVIQQARWRIRDLYRELKPCRFSLIVALIGWPVFVCVAQGTEILRTVGEGTAMGGTWERFRICFFFSALMLWATTSWYAARVLLYFDFPAQRGVARSKFAEALVPRMHHRTKTFVEEYRAFLARHRIEYNERYLLG